MNLRQSTTTHPVQVEAFDFSARLSANFCTTDYVIVKIDIEGAEHDVLEKVIAEVDWNIGTDQIVDSPAEVKWIGNPGSPTAPPGRSIGRRSASQGGTRSDEPPRGTDVSWAAAASWSLPLGATSESAGRCAHAYGLSIRSGHATTCNHCVGDEPDTP